MMMNGLQQCAFLLAILIHGVVWCTGQGNYNS